MGITHAILKVKEHCKSEKIAEGIFLINSGVIYSLVSGKILNELDIEPYKEMSMALQDTFWGARFGMLKDKFRVSWMFNCEIKKT